MSSISIELLTRVEAAKILGLKPQTLAAWAMTGRHLPFVKIGRAVRYKLADVKEFIDQQTVGTVGCPGNQAHHPQSDPQMQDSGK